MENKQVKRKRPNFYLSLARPLTKNKYVEQGGFWRRVGAFLIDFLSAALIGVLAYFAVLHPLWFSQMGGQQLHETLKNEEIKSELYFEVTETNNVTGEVATATRLLTDIYFRPGDFGDEAWKVSGLDEETFVLSDSYYDYALRYFYGTNTEPGMYYDGFIFSQSTYYDKEERPTKNYNRDILLLTGEEDDFIKAEPKLNIAADGSEYYTFTYAEGTSAQAINDWWQGRYYEAVNENFKGMPAYFNPRREIAISFYILIGVGYLIGGALFHVAVPLLSNDGQSIGKMVCKLAVVNREGYRAKWWQIVFRALFTDVIEVIGSFALFLMPLLFTMATLTLSRQQRSIHDFVFQTRVINWDNSYIFNSEEEANEYEEAKASGRPTNIYPGGGLGKKQMEQRLKAAKERYK
ncbi:MAG: RDD family protein [Erysipelotrichaceae bacterium]|nr:RDD family protein [Erysipelotrichaceae bacterium]